jgi:hypothetical protein
VVVLVANEIVWLSEFYLYGKIVDNSTISPLASFFHVNHSRDETFPGRYQKKNIISDAKRLELLDKLGAQPVAQMQDCQDEKSS